MVKYPARCGIVTLTAMLILVAFLAGQAFCATALISSGDSWKYLDDGSDQGVAWQAIDCNDVNWASGPSQLGYGDGGEATVVSYGPDSGNKFITTYFRHSFSVADASAVGGLKLRLVRDDGAIVYLNGSEVARNNMTGGSVDYQTYAGPAIGGSDESAWYEYSVDSGLLVTGNNVVAVEIHQTNAGSSDISFDLELLEAEHMKKGPYLMYTGVNTQMMVLWQIDSTSTCTLEWGTDTGYGDGSVQTVEFGGDHQHEYIIDNLTPGTVYYYQVSDGFGATYEGSFTASPASDATNVKFLAFGDTRADSGLVPDNYESVVSAMLDTIAFDPGYQTMALHVADWNYGDTESDWSNMWFNRSLPNAMELHSTVPVQGCVGNHEFTNGDGSNYKKYYPYPYVDSSRFYWSFDYGPVHVAVVDQYTDYSTGSDQLLWLENDLANSTAAWKFIVLHEPAWSADGGHPNNGTSQTYIQPLCLAYGVDIVFGGHVHYYARCDVDGVQHVTTGGGGAPLHTPGSSADYLVTAEKVYEFCEIDIQGSSLSFTARRLDGSVIDSFILGPDTTPPSPDPMTWATAPSATGSDSISMTATTASDISDVMYYFENTSISGHNSGWQQSTTYVDSGLAADTSYDYIVKARDSSLTSLSPVSVSAITGEKPQSKVWTHGGLWWAVMPDSSGTVLWKLVGKTWVNSLSLSSDTDTHADVKVDGDVAHILLYRGASSELVSVEYVSASQSYQLWTIRPGAVSISLDAGVETATIDIDSTGRMWLGSDATNDINVRWSDWPYDTWSGPVTVGTGVSTDDICVVTALGSGEIGVMWNNLNTMRFGFKVHADGADPAIWSADEVPASQSALDNIGGGMADDHINVAVSSDGTLYAAIKTEYDTANYPQMALLVRRPGGTWDDLYEVDTFGTGTRPIVLVNDADQSITVIYTGSTAGGNIVYKQSSMSSISFDAAAYTLIAGVTNNVSSMKQNAAGRYVVISSDSSKAYGVLVSTTGLNETAYSVTASATTDPPPPPGKATNPAPSGAGIGVTDVTLTWDAGSDAISHDVYFGTNPVPGAGEFKVNQGGTSYTVATLVSPLGYSTTYYWRIDERNSNGVMQGDVWSFTTMPEPAPGQATNPNPSDSEPNIPIDSVSLLLKENLTWTKGDRAISHNVYLGTNLSLVANATVTSPEYMGNETVATYYPTDKALYNTTYHWRIDEIGPGGTTPGQVWSFVTEIDNYAPDFDYVSPVTWTAHTVTIGWTTNEQSTSRIDLYDESLDFISTVENTAPVTSHSMTLTGLSALTIYNYRIVSVDDSLAKNVGYYPSETGLLTFTTDDNTPPQANPDNYLITEDQTLTVSVPGLLVNDTDLDGDVLTVSLAVGSGPVNGTLIGGLGTDGSFTYQPNPDFFGNDSFDYFVNDGFVDSAAVTVDITVIPANDPPIAQNDSATVDEEGSVDIDVTANDSDVEDVTVSLLSFTQPANGTTQINGSMITYTPDPDFFGFDSFDYTVEDIDEEPATATVSIEVYSVNDAPVADDQSAGAFADTPVDITLTASDLANESQTLTYSVVAGPAVGTLTGAAPSLTYDSQGYVGNVSFTFLANDGLDDSNIATVTITVSAVNHPPVADDQLVNVNEDEINVPIILTGNDIDPGNVLTFNLESSPTNGTLSGTAPNLYYTPNAEYNGPDSFTFTINDGHVDSNIATVSIVVAGVNDPPFANDDTAVTSEAVPVTIDVLGNDGDPEGDTLTIDSVAFDLLIATVDVNPDGSDLTYTPLPGIIGQDSFTYTITDGNGGISNTATVTVQINEAYAYDFADGESTNEGSPVASSDFADTWASDNVPEIIDEIVSRSKRSTLDNVWTLNVTGGTEVTFYVEAWHDDTGEGDDFAFAYSTDNDVYSTMLTVSKTADNDAYQSFVLPASVSGTVYIRVVDTDNTRRNQQLDTLYVDHMYIESRTAPPVPDTTPPSPDPDWAVAPYVTSATSISMTATTVTDENGVEYYFACVGVPSHDSGWQDSPTYEDTGLQTSVSYTYQVIAHDKSVNQNETGWSAEASATPTDIPPAAPTNLAATGGNGVVNLDWDDNGEGDLAGYNVYRSTTDGGPYSLVEAIGPTSSYTDSAVTNGTTYYYVVSAVDNGANESGNSNQAQATPGVQPSVTVETIVMTLDIAKKTTATAELTIAPGLAGASVTGDWYFKGNLAISGSFGITDGNGMVTIDSPEKKARSNDVFEFRVTDVALNGHNYDAGSSVTSASIAVPEGT